MFPKSNYLGHVTFLSVSVSPYVFNFITVAQTVTHIKMESNIKDQ